MPSGSLISVSPLVGMGKCGSFPPVFDDVDGDALTITISTANVPASIRLVDGSPFISPAGDLVPSASGTTGRLFIKGYARTTTTVRIDLTAADPHGGSVSTFLNFSLVKLVGNNKTPTFSKSVGSVNFDRDQEGSTVLPAATGGDPGGLYTYTASGLPTGLGFDPATRTISGTPTVEGSYTVTYEAEDFDSTRTAADTASQTFTLNVVDPAPVFSSGSVIGTAVTLTFDRNLDTGSTPAGSDFTVTATPPGSSDGTDISGSGTVTVTGKTVAFNLASAVEVGHTTTVSYTKPGSNALRGIGTTGDVATFSGKTIANGDPAPVLSSGSVDGTTVNLIFDRNLDTDSKPAASAFTVTATSGGTTTTRISGSGTVTIFAKAVAFNLASAVGVGDTTTVSYTRPDSNALRGSGTYGNAVATFSARTVTNNTTEPHTFPFFSDRTATFSIAEDHADGATVATVTASDADGDDVTYSLASGDDSDSFTIGSGDGVIKVRAGVTLDYEAKSSYSLTAQVTDGEDPWGREREPVTIDDTMEVTVTVSNVAEPPGAPTGVTVQRPTATTLRVSWSAPADTGALPITDYDVRYAAGSADPGDEADWIEAGGSGGHDHAGTETETTIAGLSPSTAYRVQVRATGDGSGPWSASGGGRTTAPARGDTVPRFVGGAAASFAIAEDHADGAAVGQVAAADDDADELTYSLASGGDNDSFTIDGDGVIRVQAGVRLNREVQERYTVSAQVSDGEDARGSAESTASIDATITVTITVTAPASAAGEEEVPGTPAGVRVSAVTASSLTVSWSAPSEGGAVADYDVRYAAGRADPADQAEWMVHEHAGTATRATITGLTAGTAYRVQVRAVGASAAGPWSASAAGTPAAASEPRAPRAVSEAVRRVLKHTLATLATRTLGSALDHVGTRFAGGAPAPPVTAVTVDGLGLPRAAAGDRLLAPHPEQMTVVELSEVLRTSAFEAPLGAGAGGGPRWALWGRGDYGDFAGRLPSDARYEGTTLGGWIGADVRSGAWLGGLAVSHALSTVEYDPDDGDAAAAGGELQTSLTALHPYASVSFLDRFTLQVLGGAGLGEARHAPGGGAAAESSELWVLMGSVGLRGRIVSVDWLDLSARADGGYAHTWTAEGDGVVDELTADGWRGRLGLEVATRVEPARTRRWCRSPR